MKIGGFFIVFVLPGSLGFSQSGTGSVIPTAESGTIHSIVWGLLGIAVVTLLVLGMKKFLLSKNRALAQESLRYREKNDELVQTNERLNTIYGELQKAYQDFGELLERFESIVEVLSKVGNNELDEKSFFGLFLGAALKIIPIANYGTVSLIMDHEWRFIAVEGYDGERLMVLRLPEENIRHIYEVTVVDALYDRYERHIDESVRDPLKEAVKPFKQSLLTPFIVDGKFYGTMALDIARENEATFTDGMKKVMTAFSKIASAFLAFKRQSVSQGKFQKNIILSLVRALEYYDRYTRGHSERVARIASLLAEAAGLDRESIRKIYWASLVHDVGKIYVPQLILNKAGKLTEEEFEEIRKHPGKSYEIIKETEGMDEIAQMVRHHHERWDGTGYPDRFIAEEIPISSRIITIADAYDAMTSERPYRKSIRKASVIEEFRRTSGTQFDPRLTNLFIGIISRTDFQE